MPGYRSADRPVDAARVATALAWDYRIFRGEPAVGDGWLARARRLLEAAGPTREAGWLALRKASFALPQDTALARRRCAEAHALGRQLPDVYLEMTALALEGLVQVSQGEIAEGMARLDEATTAATTGEMRDFPIGFSCCYLIFACERVRDIERAGQWCVRLARIAAAANDQALLPVCRTHYGTVLMLRGEWAAAEAELGIAAAAMAARPGQVADARARLAELRRRQGRPEEAAVLLAEAEHHPLSVLCRAAIALDRGDAAEVRRRPARGGPGAPGRRKTGRGTRGLQGCRGAARARRAPVRDGARAGRPSSRAARAGPRDAARRELDRAAEAFSTLGAAGELRRVAALRASRAGGAGETLSRREGEVLSLVAQGRTNAEIASSLVLSEHTVHRHVANILAKFGTSSRAAAVAKAAEQGLL